MAKRFVDTRILQKKWYRTLSPKMKSVWWYVVLGCDHAGIMDIDEEDIRHNIGEGISIDEIIETFKNRFSLIDNDSKIFIDGFVEFQYGELKETNRVHVSVIKLLQKYGLCKDLVSPLQGAKDIYIYKDKDKDKLDFEALYKKYPLKKGKTKGIEKCVRQIKNLQDYEKLSRAIDAYVLDVKDDNPKYIKHFSTFMSSWEDWVQDEAKTDMDKIKEELGEY